MKRNRTSAPSSSSVFARVGHDILVHCLGWLSPVPELALVKRTCRDWRSAAERAESTLVHTLTAPWKGHLAEDLTLSTIPPVWHPDAILASRSASHWAKNLRHLTLQLPTSWIMAHAWSSSMMERLEAWLSSCKQLRTIKLVESSSTQVDHTPFSWAFTAGAQTERIGRLLDSVRSQRLEMVVVDSDDSYASAEWWLQHSPTLLHVDCCVIGTQAILFPKLTRLRSYCYLGGAVDHILGDWSVKAWHNRFPRLQSLELVVPSLSDQQNRLIEEWLQHPMTRLCTCRVTLGIDGYWLPDHCTSTMDTMSRTFEFERRHQLYMDQRGVDRNRLLPWIRGLQSKVEQWQTVRIENVRELPDGALSGFRHIETLDLVSSGNAAVATADYKVELERGGLSFVNVVEVHVLHASILHPWLTTSAKMKLERVHVYRRLESTLTHALEEWAATMRIWKGLPWKDGLAKPLCCMFSLPLEEDLEHPTLPQWTLNDVDQWISTHASDVRPRICELVKTVKLDDRSCVELTLQ